MTWVDAVITKNNTQHYLKNPAMWNLRQGSLLQLEIEKVIRRIWHDNLHEIKWNFSKLSASKQMPF